MALAERGLSRGFLGRWLNPGPAVMFILATFASLCVAAMLAVVIWLSFVDGLPGDPQLTYSLVHYKEILLDSFTYRVIANTLVFCWWR